MSEPQPINPGPPDRELFLAVLERPADQRETFLAAQCGNDSARRQRVAALLAEHQTESSFLDSPALARSGGGTKVMGTTLTQNDIPLGERIGRYKLLQQIGEGGCGVVYMAEQEEPVRRRVALKIIKLGMDTKGVIARFEAERQALAMMDHPNIAKVLDAGATETGRPYFVMELVRGIKITDYADQSSLATEDRLKLFIQVCNAIQHAHQKGIIHRDIKPSNILVTLHDGVPVPKVIDFGIAKAIEQKLTDKTLFTQFQAFIGTPAYMSPEQAEMSGLDIDTRSDIYSLGVLLYEILTGETPFDPQALISKGIDECRRTIREQEPARPSNRLATMLAADLTTTAQHRRIEAARLIYLLQGDLDWIVMKCIEKDRSRRYDTATGLAGDVQRYLNNEAVLARPPSKVYRLRKFLQKNRAPVAAAATIALLLIVGSTVSFWLAFRAWNAEVDARQNAQVANVQAARAEQKNRAARLNEYVADIGLAQQSLKDGNFAKAVQLLEKHLPPPGEPDLRGFEWRYLWELSRGDEHVDLPPHDGGVQSLAVSPDGQFLAVSVRDRLHIWNTRTRERVTTLAPREGAPVGPPGPGQRGGRSGGGFRFAGFNSVAFLADGSALVVASAGSVRIWNTRDWTEQSPLTDSSGSVSVAPGGSLVAVTKGGFMRRDGVALYDSRDWREVRVLADARAPFAFSADGARLVSDSPEGIIIWPIADGAGTIALENSTNVFEGGVPGWNPDRSLALSPAGNYVAAARNQPSERGVFVVNLWDARTGADLGTLPESAEQIEHTGVISALAFSPDGGTLATASLDHSIRLWRVADRKRIATLQGHLNEVWTLAFSPDGQTLYTGAKDGSVKIWSTTRSVPNHELAAATTPLGFSRDSSTLATLTPDRTVAFINLATGEKVREFALATNRSRGGPEPGRPQSQVVALSADFRMLAQGGRDGWVHLWNTETGETNLVKVADKDIDSLIISPDGGVLVTRSRGPMSTPTWYDVRAGTNFLWQVEADRMAFSPDGRWLATAHRSEAPKLWQASDRSLRATLELPEPESAFTLAFSPDGSRLAVTYADHTIGIWDTERGQLVGICTGHKQPAFAVAFSADGGTLASAGADSTLRMWNVATQQELLVDRRLGFNLRNLIFSPDGHWLVGASGNPPKETTRLFKARAVSDAEVTSRLASKRPQLH